MMCGVGWGRGLWGQAQGFTLFLTKLLLGPVLLFQGTQVRRHALVLPEAPGPRAGQVGRPGGDQPPLRLLIVGDSSAAGVGVACQSQALAATVAQHMQQALQRPVAWQLLAATGWTSADALGAVRGADAGLAPADVWVSVLAVNDVVRQRPPHQTVANLAALHAELQQRCGVRHGVLCGAPPMQHFPLLPAPLRWLLGAQAARLNHALQAASACWPDRSLLALPPDLMTPTEAAPGLMAEDGFHPGPAGYALWGRVLAEHLADRLVQGGPLIRERI